MMVMVVMELMVLLVVMVLLVMLVGIHKDISHQILSVSSERCKEVLGATT